MQLHFQFRESLRTPPLPEVRLIGQIRQCLMRKVDPPAEKRKSEQLFIEEYVKD